MLRARLHALAARIGRATLTRGSSQTRSLTSFYRPGGSGRVSPPPAPGVAMATGAAGPPGASPPSTPGASPPPSLPPPLTVIHLPTPTPTPSDLTVAFTSLGFGKIKGPIKLEPEAILRAHAVPTPRLLGVSEGHFLLSLAPDPAENDEGAAAALTTEALQLSAGQYLLMPANVRHTAWVTGGAPVALWMGEREEG